MPISINGTGSITGLSAGGLPDGSITAADLASGAARSNFGAGAVLQVVEAEYDTPVTIASTTFTDTGLSASITPSSATNKILVLIQQKMSIYRLSTDSGAAVKIVRTIGATSTDIHTDSGTTAAFGLSIGNATQSSGELTVFRQKLDSPSTTSACTYKTQGRVQTTANSGSSGWNNGAASRIILMEIAA